MINKKEVVNFFNNLAPKRYFWNKKNRHYHRAVEKIIRFLVEEDRDLLEVGCGLGQLIESTKPRRGVGIDISSEMIKRAKKRYPKYKFIKQDIEHLKLVDKFDYIIASDLIGSLNDIQKAFENLRSLSIDQTRLILTYYNYFWEPFLKFASFLGLSHKLFNQNWLSTNDVSNLLYLSGFETIKKGEYFIFPFNVPFIGDFINRVFSRLPILRSFCLINYIIARPLHNFVRTEYTVSVIVPARNEAGNIENVVKRIPEMGNHTEIIFVEGGSEDNTREEIQRILDLYRNRRDIKLIDQGKGVGKGDAVRRGFDAAKGEILMILDADLSVSPEDLDKFYRAIATRKGEFINGSRLVYQLEKDSMRILNIFGNKIFSVLFTWILDQKIKDTLCGTKALFRSDYLRIARGRKYFGNFDPFGDFDLLFGASKLALKIVDIPIRYQARVYGHTNISRFKHGLLLLRMSIYGALKFKFS